MPFSFVARPDELGPMEDSDGWNTETEIVSWNY